jgi:hypothetical protein
MQGLWRKLETGLSESAEAELLRQEGLPATAPGSRPETPQAGGASRAATAEETERRTGMAQAASEGFTYLAAGHFGGKPNNHRADLDDHGVNEPGGDRGHPPPALDPRHPDSGREQTDNGL